jgi:hypothetical protein
VTGFGLANGFNYPVYTALLTTSNYSAIANLQPAVSSKAVAGQRLLTAEIFQLHALRFYLHSLPYRSKLLTNSSLAGSQFTPTS